MMIAGASLDDLLRRDRRWVLCGLAAAAALAWAYQLYMAWGMRHMSPAMAALMPNMQLWRARDLFLLFAMWVVMMAAMMLPSVAPTVLVFAAMQRKRDAAQNPLVATGVFLAGYLTAWGAFSLVATIAQWWLHKTAIVSAAMETTSPLVAGALLVATGLFQWTPWKDTCLARCRSPIGLILGHWRAGVGSAFRLGVLNGSFCVGCCALLMALLFVNGVMNVVWMAILTGFVLVEKLVPAGRWTARIAGVALCAWGIGVIVAR